MPKKSTKKDIEHVSDASDSESVEEKPTKKKVSIKKSKKINIEDDVSDSESVEEKPTKKSLVKSKKTPVKKSKKIIEDDEVLESSDDSESSGSESEVKKKTNAKTKAIKSTLSDNVDPKRILEIHTTQTAEFKKAIERVANVITECCITFIAPVEGEEGKDNVGGIRIFKLSSDKAIMIKVKLDASKFERFFCGEQKITIGVDMPALHGFLKTINDSDTLMLYMNRDQRSVLFINSVSESDTGLEKTDLVVHLMDLANPEKELKPTKFDNIIIMSAKKFNDICKSLNANSTRKVEIATVNGELSFSGSNEGGKITKIYSDKESNKKVTKTTQKIVQGVYDLKNLVAFSKCGKMSDTIALHLKNDFPLILALAIGSLGNMYVFLAPIDPNDN